MKCSRIALGSDCGGIFASAKNRFPSAPARRELKAKPPQEFRTRIGETPSRIELECFPRRSKWTVQFRPKT